MTFDPKILARAAETAFLGNDPAPPDLSGLLEAIKALNEADLSSISPLYSLLEETAGPRPDEPGRGADPDELLNLAPERVGRFFAVPKIV